MTGSPVDLNNDEVSHLEGLIEGLDGLKTTQIPPFLEAPLNQEGESRLKSPLKMRYSAEVEVIKKRWGDLESIRNQLGLSQRKISQLLMVDPSAWTRWTKYEDNAPPHIYRALSWFLTLQEKDPSSGNPYLWLQSVARPSLPKSEIRAISEDVRSVVLGEAQEKLHRAYSRMKWLVVLNFALLVLLLGATVFRFF